MTTSSEPTTQAKGDWAEKVALEYLQKQGLTLIRQNYRTRRGEIDLIMQDNDITAFIEVRYRSASNYANAVESIDHRKCERIIKTCQHYLLSCRRPANVSCRFDIITVTGERERPQIGWIKNAFEA